MEANMDVEFPCGYKFKMNAKAGIMDWGSIKANDDLPDVCPLHGKNCPPK